VQNFLGGADEDWFIDVHIDIEQRAARVITQAGPAIDAAGARDIGALCDALHEIAAGTEDMVHTLERMPEHCDPYIYYRRVRPYIHGWRNHPALPAGVVYEGVTAYRGLGQKFRGETGAQSGIVPALDALLGVEHADDPLRTYLLEMRDYMPPGHRRFVAEIEQTSPVRPLVQERARSEPQLREAYNECIHWLEAFRTTHLEYAASYIFSQEQVDAANPTDVGTGGTPFMVYLKKHRDESASQRIA
jgi:indoleamine 2,3-dioxygenase